jgi:hypothetical protein
MSTDDKSSSSYVDRQTMKVVAQLLKAVPTMHHVDEIFQWLAYTIVQQFGIQVVQVWANQVDYTGQMTIQLLTMARQDSTVLEQVVVNEDVAQVAQRIVGERSMHIFRSVESQFSSYRARMLQRYGLHYYAGCQIHQNAGQLAMRNATTFTPASSFLAIAVLLFVKQAPHTDLLSTISFIMNQAVAIAEKRGLLLPPSAAAMTARTTGDILTPTPTPRPTSQQGSPVLEQLVPRRKDEGDFMLSSNPFTSSSAVIKDKTARRLYMAIDGRMNVEALCESTGMSMKEVYAALQTLLSQRRIEMHEANGRLIDTKLFLK